MTFPDPGSSESDPTRIEPEPAAIEPISSPGTPPGPVVAPPSATTGPHMFCFACGAQIDARAEVCPRCGVRQRAAPAAIRPLKKDKLVAALLAIFLGGLGIHKFYLGKIAQGVIYLIFCWTFIPSIIGFIEGILYLTRSDESWAAEWGG